MPGSSLVAGEDRKFAEPILPTRRTDVATNDRHARWGMRHHQTDYVRTDEDG